MTTYAILGAGGAFGIHTARYLCRQPGTDWVMGVGRNPLRPQHFTLDIDKEPNYEYHAYHTTYEWDLLLDLLNRKRPDIIINFAAQGEGAVSWKNSWRFFETNSMGLVRLVENLMAQSWEHTFIQIGTSEMYGSVTAPAREDAPINPSSPYAASKVAFDLYLLSVHRVQGYPAIILRPSNAYGPGQLLHRVIPKAFWCGLNGVQLPLHGGGRAAKSYIHTDDLASAIYAVGQRGKLGHVYNAGPKEPTTIREVVERCAATMGLTFEELCVVTGDRQGQDGCYWLDSSAIKQDTGWEPQVGWDEGLATMYQWSRRYADAIRHLPTDYVMRG